MAGGCREFSCFVKIKIRPIFVKFVGTAIAVG